jgi:hypothetical protein
VARQINRLLLEPTFVEGIIPPGNGLMAFQDVPQVRSERKRSAIEQQNTLNVPAGRVGRDNPEEMTVTQVFQLICPRLPLTSKWLRKV